MSPYIILNYDMQLLLVFKIHHNLYYIFSTIYFFLILLK